MEEDKKNLDEIKARISLRLSEEYNTNTDFAISAYRTDLLSILNKRDIKVLLECENLLFALAFCDSTVDVMDNFNHNADEFHYSYRAFFSLLKLLSFLGIRE